MSNLSKLNKDLLIKLIEEINDPEKLSIEELGERIKTYREIQNRKIHEQNTKNVKDLLLKLEIIPYLTDFIREHKEDILNLTFPIDKNKYTEEEYKSSILSKIKIRRIPNYGLDISFDLYFGAVSFIYHYQNYENHLFERVSCPTNKHEFHIKLTTDYHDTMFPNRNYHFNKQYILVEYLFIEISSHECF